MKARHPLLFLLLPAASLLAAPSSIGLLPQEKTPETVAPGERNPFGARRIVTQAPALKASGDEAQIRAVIARLPLSGLTSGYGVIKVLLGPYTLEEGKIMPAVIPNQVERVRVVAISSQSVELSFVDKDGSAATRKMTLPIKLAPTVRIKIGFSAATKEGEVIPLDGVKKNEGETSR